MPAQTGPLPRSLVLFGAGKMGGAMLEGWLSAGMAPGAVTIVDPFLPVAQASELAGRGVAVNPEPGEIAPAEAMVLAIKPQTLESAAEQATRLVGPQTTLISVLAGKTVSDLRTRIPSARAVVRAMPNLPASIGRGATGAFANAETSAAGRAMAERLLRSVGSVEWVEQEDLIDAVTAVSGSGPAYVFLLAECLAQAGERAGLPPELSARLARVTVSGAGELLARSDLPASTLRENVTSPGGTTAAALAVLMDENGLAPLMHAAVAAAKRRAEELSG